MHLYLKQHYRIIEKNEVIFVHACKVILRKFKISIDITVEKLDRYQISRKSA